MLDHHRRSSLGDCTYCRVRSAWAIYASTTTAISDPSSVPTHSRRYGTSINFYLHRLPDGAEGVFKLACTAQAAGTSQLRDMLTWSWVQPGEVRFVSTKPALKLVRRKHFEKLCRALLYNFPGLRYRPHDKNLFRPVPSDLEREHDWTATAAGAVEHKLVALTTREYHTDTPNDTVMRRRRRAAARVCGHRCTSARAR